MAGTPFGRRRIFWQLPGAGSRKQQRSRGAQAEYPLRELLELYPAELWDSRFGLVAAAYVLDLPVKSIVGVVARGAVRLSRLKVRSPPTGKADRLVRSRKDVEVQCVEGAT